MNSNVLWTMLKGLNLWSILLFVYRTNGGREAVRRFLTPPESFVRATCKVTGANAAVALDERKEAVQESLEFLEALVSVDFNEDHIKEDERI